MPGERLDELAGLDTVLYVELSRPGGVGHDFSMAVMGVDYIRPGGFGTRFSGAPVTLGILDTGFMVGGAAATTHQDLNKFGCGRNFTSDAAGVWNDQHGHGTHVLATISGTGTAQARFRGAATGLGGSGATRIRAAKIWNSGGNGSEAQELSGQDYMDDGPDCGSDRPQVVSVSGGATGMNQTGTDARSRGLDQRVWDARQTWVVCSGNSGPGAGTIWSAGVAKNALTVGNVRDAGDGTIGDINGDSSHGPTGDGRMKPTIVATGTRSLGARRHDQRLHRHERLQHGDAARLGDRRHGDGALPGVPDAPAPDARAPDGDGAPRQRRRAGQQHARARRHAQHLRPRPRVALRRSLGPLQQQRLVDALGVADDHPHQLGLP